MINGIARLAGSGRFLLGSGMGAATGMAFGLGPGEAIASGIIGELGTMAGGYAGRKLGGGVGEYVGSAIGGFAGNIGGMMAPSLLPHGEPMPNPDSSQQDPQAALSVEDIERIHRRAQQREAEAQYQLMALQQYGGQQ